MSTSISFFTAIGGLDFRFEAAEFKTRLALELYNYACRTLRTSRNWSLTAVITLMLLVGQNGWSQTLSADSIYFGGDILTMAGSTPEYVEAVAVKDGSIVYVGSRTGADELRRDNTDMVDLQGRALLPGFIDGHSHPVMYMMQMDWANLFSPPMGSISSIDDILEELKANQRRRKLSTDTWLFGVGYDPDLLGENRHPSAADLDKVFPDTPVVIAHASGHMVVANSMAMAAKGINAETADPQGGVIVRKPGTNEPHGLFQEVALYTFLPELFPEVPAARQAEKLEKVLHYYASVGLTTAQEGALLPVQVEVLHYASAHDMLPIDLVALPLAISSAELLGDDSTQWGVYDGRLKLGGLKISLDGSPQGKTAFLSKHYDTPVPGCDIDCLGTPLMPAEKFEEILRAAYTAGVQAFVHANGDGAIDMLISGHTSVLNSLGESPRELDRRTIVIHSQIMRPDQIDSYANLGLIPTFFTNHSFYWGDVHQTNLGGERAAYTSPMRAAFDKGIKATNHTDLPVTSIDPLFTVWSAVNRVSRSGVVIGPQQRISAYEALQAITINGAHQYFEENSKGSLEVGKRADLVMLDRNPLKVDAADIKDIEVLLTVKDGETIYKDLSIR